MNDLSLRNIFYNNLKSLKGNFYYRDRYRTWKYSFSDLLASSLRFSSFLKASGIGKGDKILIKAPSSPDWIKVFIGCVMCGVIAVPLDFKSSRDFVKMVAEDVEPSISIISRKDSEDQLKVLKEMSFPSLFIEDIEEKVDVEEELDYSEIEINDDDIVEIVYTSGTTSTPKGVLLTYKNIQSNLQMALPVIEKWRRFLKMIPGSKLLSVVPLSHMYGQVVGIFIPVAIGMSVLFSYSILPGDIIETVKREKIVALGALPQQLQVLKDYMEQAYSLDTKEFKRTFEKYKKKRWWIRYPRFFPLHYRIGIPLLAIISGGAHIKKEVDEFYRTLAFGFFQGYGLTETAPLLALFDPMKSKEGSVGSFLDNENIKVEDGELYVRGSNVTPGYYKNRKKTREHFKNGWFKTGDIVEIDESGNVFLKGRKDDLIVRESGINVYPSDIAEKFRKRIEIKDCAVFGMDTDGSTQIIAVLLLKDKNMDKSEIDEVVDQVNNELNVHQKVDDYLIWKGQDFPRTSSMNIKKREILETLQQTQQGEKARDLGIEERQEKEDIYDLIEKIKKTRGKRDKQAVLEKDIGMDSLDIISLATEIEKKYGIDASQIDITSDTKVQDIEEKIKNPPKKGPVLPFYNFAFNVVFVVLRTIFQYLIFPFVRMLYRSRIRGRENLAGVDLPTAFISNHVSVMDSLVILYSLPLRIRKRIAVVMSTGHHFTHFFLKNGNALQRFIEGFGFYLFIGLYINVIPLSRKSGFDQVFKNIGMALDRGWNVLVFPEGAVTLDGKTQRFEHGIGILCKDLKAPVIPLRIDGLHRILRNGLLPLGHFPRIPLVKTSFGKQQYDMEGSYKDIAERLYRLVAEKL